MLNGKNISALLLGASFFVGGESFAVAPGDRADRGDLPAATTVRRSPALFFFGYRGKKETFAHKQASKQNLPVMQAPPAAPKKVALPVNKVFEKEHGNFTPLWFMGSRYKQASKRQPPITQVPPVTPKKIAAPVNKTLETKRENFVPMWFMGSRHKQVRKQSLDENREYLVYFGDFDPAIKNFVSLFSTQRFGQPHYEDNDEIHFRPSHLRELFAQIREARLRDSILRTFQARNGQLEF